MADTHPLGARRTALVAALLVVATVAAYATVRQCDFISLDDPDYVTHNPMVAQGLSWNGVVTAFTTGHAANYHPLTWISHMVDVEFYGLRPAGHHLTNLLLHLGATLLLFAFLARTTAAVWASGVAAALFALHPAHVESVAWIAERKDVLSTLLAMAAIWAYRGYALRPSPGRLTGVALLLAAGLLAKPMLVSLPLLLLLLDYWPLRRPLTLRLVWEKLPLFGLAAASCVVTFIAQSSGGAVQNLRIPLAIRLDNAVVSYVRYLGTFLWPVDLSLLYPHPYTTGEPWSRATVVGCGLLLLLTTAGVVALRDRRHLVVGWLWYLCALVPVIGVVQVGVQAMADRYTYLPFIGIGIACVWEVQSHLEQRPALRPAVAGVASVLLVVLALLTARQVGGWRDSATLYERSLAATPKSWALHNNLGNTYYRLGRYDRAIGEFETILRDAGRFLTLMPEHREEAHYNLGLCYQEQGDLDAAATHYQQAIALNPANLDAVSNLGLVYLAAGKLLQAQQQLEWVVQVQPGYPPGLYNLAEVYRAANQTMRATTYYERFLRLRPDYPPAFARLGDCYERLGRLPEAVAAYRRAAALDPTDPDTQAALHRLQSPAAP